MRHTFVLVAIIGIFSSATTSSGKSVGIIAAGSAGGALIGAILGFSYHFNGHQLR